MARLKVSIWLAAAVLWCSSPLGATAQQAKQAIAGPAGDKTSSGVSGNPEHPSPAERTPRYKICRDDVLALSFPLSPELNQKVTVQPDGFISLQNAGSVHVAGLTVPELAAAVKKAYEGTLHDPV